MARLGGGEAECVFDALVDMFMPYASRFRLQTKVGKKGWAERCFDRAGVQEHM